MYHGIYEIEDLIENKGETCKRLISKRLRPTFPLRGFNSVPKWERA